MALVAGVLANAARARTSPTVVTQGLALVPDEAQVSQLLATVLTPKTLGVPVGVHGLDHSPDDKLSTLSTARSKKNMKVMFTILSSLKFVKCPIRKGAEALGTYKTLCVPQFPVGVDNLLMRFKSIPTSGTEHVSQVHSYTWHL